MANSADPDQLASSEANWSGSALFVKQGISRFSKTRVKTRHVFKVLKWSLPKLQQHLDASISTTIFQMLNLICYIFWPPAQPKGKTQGQLLHTFKGLGLGK